MWAVAWVTGHDGSPRIAVGEQLAAESVRVPAGFELHALEDRLLVLVASPGAVSASERPLLALDKFLK
jgi:hypothetical protein